MRTIRRIIGSSFEKVNEGYYDYLNELLTSDAYYKKEFKISVLIDQEVEFIQFLTSSYEKAKVMPSKDLFLHNFDDITSFKNQDVFSLPELDLKDYRVYIYNFISKRVNKRVSQLILKLNQEIETDGLTEEKMERISELYRISNLHKAKTVDINYDYQKAYLDKISKPIGMTFNIKEIDEKLFGLDYGSLTTIAGFTSHFKTLLALNLTYNNFYHNGYNIVYISLETPKEDMYWNLLCRHSSDLKFGDRFIPHELIRRGELTDDERDYLFNEVESDLKRARGKLVILDESDFDTLSFPEIYSVLEGVDDSLNGELDAFVVDYVQLFKFSGEVSYDVNTTVNSYVSFFRRLTQTFRDKKLIGVLLSQVNRDSWKRAAKNSGVYDLTCLADANELERGSHRVITTYTTDSLKTQKEAQLQILKNRYGQTLYEPTSVFADGERYIIGEEISGFGSPSSSFSGGFEDALSDVDIGDIK